MTKKKSVGILVLHGVVITMDGKRRIFADGGVAIDEDRIVAVGRSSEIEDSYDAERYFDARGCAVQPGFVDCHVHLSQHLGRSTIPDSWPDEREHEQWLPYWLNLTEEDVQCSAMLACMEMVRNGTTAFCDNGGKYAGELAASAADAVGLRGIVSEVCWDRPPHPDVAVGDTDECLRNLERLTGALPRTPESRIWAGVGIAGMGLCSDDLVKGAKQLADRLDLPMSMHQSYSRSKEEQYRGNAQAAAPVQQLAELGVLGPNQSLVHMIHVVDEEIPLLVESGTTVVHCPGASVRMGMGASRIGRFPEMVEQGVNMTLGCDSGNYSDFFDIGRQAYLAATIHRDNRGLVPVISAEQVLEMATVNAARSLGMEALIGSLEPGRKADLVIHSFRRPEWHPGLDVVTSLVYSAQSTGVDTVIVDGEVVLENGRFTLVDEEAELARIDRAAGDLYRRMEFPIQHRWPWIT